MLVQPRPTGMLTFGRMDKKTYISELAEIIDRRPNTIRGWEREGKLPSKLMPKRDEKDYRYWTDEQVALFVKWVMSLDRHPGMGLPNYNPTRQQIESHIKNTRRKSER